ncbi:MAG: MliC family protein [Klebsiella pneumoniae]|nr:MliC family protein [Klebsiella pneumoniae]
MKKILIAVVPFMLAGCSYYNQFVERMQTDTLEYQCDQKPSEGLSASGARYTDGVYVFWSKGDTATVYKRDRIVLDNCQLQTAKR